MECAKPGTERPACRTRQRKSTPWPGEGAKEAEGNSVREVRDGKGPNVADLAERVKALQAANTIEAAARREATGRPGANHGSNSSATLAKHAAR